MGNNLSAIRAIVRQFLKDEFVSGEEFTWEDDELDLHIGHCLKEISKSSAYETKETLTTTANSKELDTSSITDLLDVDKVEYPVDKDPPEFRNHSIWGDILTIDTTISPSAGENVYLYCEKLHQLTESSSTLKPREEMLLVDGVVAYAAISKAREHINAVNIGGGRTAADMLAWGQNKLAIYKLELRGLVKPRVHREYPKD